MDYTDSVRSSVAILERTHLGTIHERGGSAKNTVKQPPPTPTDRDRSLLRRLGLGGLGSDAKVSQFDRGEACAGSLVLKVVSVDKATQLVNSDEKSKSALNC